MIRVFVVEHSGHMTLDVVGHARSDVCAAVSALFQGCRMSLQAVAKTYPREVSVEYFAPPKKRRRS